MCSFLLFEFTPFYGHNWFVRQRVQFCLNKIKMTDFPGQNHLSKGDNKHVRPGNILKPGNMGQASLFFGIFGIRGTRAGSRGIAQLRITGACNND